MPSPDGPHQDQPLLDHGASLTDAAAAMILLHGRGASARGILALADELDVPDVAYLAPQAAGRSWYPESFMAPTEQNEPQLGSALQAVGDAIAHALEAGLTEEQVLLLGFSQGACLATTYAVRHPQRYGGVVGLSGGLIGPEAPVDVEGLLDGTPIFLGCSDQDPYIPLERVQETADVFRDLGASVTERVYEGMGHTTNEDELRHIRTLLGEHVPLDD
ncbi:MAG: alpha/beta hydrolase [Salinibacter sp.]